jgi:putative transposase
MNGGATLAEIATALAVDKSTISRLATRENWAFEERAGKGGRAKLFDVAVLPEDVRAALTRHQLVVPTGASPPVISKPRPSARREIAAWQIATRDARLHLIAEVAALSVRMRCSHGKAIDALVDLARMGQLRPDLMARVPVANARSGGAGARTLSRTSLYRWMRAHDRDGADALLPLAPRRLGRKIARGPAEGYRAADL